MSSKLAIKMFGGMLGPMQRSILTGRVLDIRSNEAIERDKEATQAKRDRKAAKRLAVWADKKAE